MAGTPRCWYLICRVKRLEARRLARLQNGGGAEAAGRAHGHQSPCAPAGLLAVLCQLLRCSQENAGAGGAEWMAQSDRTAVHVEPCAVDGAERPAAPQRAAAVALVLPGCQCAKHLAAEGFVDFIEVKILEGQAVAIEQPRYGIYRRHEQPFRVGPE